MAKERDHARSWVWAISIIIALVLASGMYLDYRNMQYVRVSDARASERMSELYEAAEAADDAVTRLQLVLYLSKLEDCLDGERGNDEALSDLPWAVAGRSPAWGPSLDPDSIRRTVRVQESRCHQDLLDSVALSVPDGASALAAELKDIGASVPASGNGRAVRNRQALASLPTNRGWDKIWESTR